MKFSLNLPNDYGSEADDLAALRQAYGADFERHLGDSDAANLMYMPIADAAIDAGLKYLGDSDYGSVWEGTDEQFAECLESLPVWAKRYASKI